MKRAIVWIADNADAFIGLGMAVFASILGILDAVPAYVITNVTVLTLATLAFVMLRDRYRAEVAAKRVERSLTRDNAEMRQLVTKLQERLTIRVLTGPEIRPALDISRQGTENLTFKGATGAFTRAVALPECVHDRCRRKGRRLEVCIEIFDPGNESLLESYVELYQTFERPVDQQGEWDVAGTRAEILATILAACLHKQRYGLLLDIEIYLSSVLTTLRWDLTTRSLIITQRGPGYPAMLIDSEDVFYSYWSTELRASAKGAKRLPIEAAAGVRLGVQPTVDEVRKLFVKLGVSVLDSCSDDEVGKVINLAVSTDDPVPSPLGMEEMMVNRSGVWGA